jgi:hypothetical protein
MAVGCHMEAHKLPCRQIYAFRVDSCEKCVLLATLRKANVLTFSRDKEKNLFIFRASFDDIMTPRVGV